MYRPLHWIESSEDMLRFALSSFGPFWRITYVLYIIPACDLPNFCERMQYLTALAAG